MRNPRDDAGNELDALFSVGPRQGGFDLILESRGGSRAGPKASRNAHYAEGLRLHLERMKARNMVLEDIQVVSRETLKLPEADRRIEPPGFALPLSLGDVADVETLRRAIGRASAAHRSTASSGGNPTKRLKLAVRWSDASGMTADDLEGLLAGEAVASLDGEVPTADPLELEKRAARARTRIAAAKGKGTALGAGRQTLTCLCFRVAHGRREAWLTGFRSNATGSRQM